MTEDIIPALKRKIIAESQFIGKEGVLKVELRMLRHFCLIYRLENGYTDIGLDCIAEPLYDCEGGKYASDMFHIQIKGTNYEEEKNNDKKLSVPIDVQTVAEWLEKKQPVFLVVSANKMKKLFYCSVEEHRDYIRSKLHGQNTISFGIKLLKEIQNDNEIAEFKSEVNDAFRHVEDRIFAERHHLKYLSNGPTHYRKLSSDNMGTEYNEIIRGASVIETRRLLRKYADKKDEKDLKLAFDAISWIWERDTEHWEIPYYYGYVEMHRGNYQNAIKFGKKGRKIIDDDPESDKPENIDDANECRAKCDYLIGICEDIIKGKAVTSNYSDDPWDTQSTSAQKGVKNVEYSGEPHPDLVEE